MKTAFLFPGQGAQYVGMAKDFYDTDADCRAFVDKAHEALDFDLKKVMFEENELINKTEYTQAAMLTAELCILIAVKKTGITADLTAGLSLGEYAALVCSGILDPVDAVKLVRQRGIYMENAVPAGKGNMAAVIGLAPDVVEDICNRINISGGVVVPANYNCPGQIVISGLAESVEKAAELLKEAGAKLVSTLNVSGPFHSPLLEKAGIKLSEALESIELKKPELPYISNVTASLVNDCGTVKELLVKQVSSPVKWEQSLALMLKRGITDFVEIGPGKTLAGFFKRIDRSIPVISVSTVPDLLKLDALINSDDISVAEAAATKDSGH